MTVEMHVKNKSYNGFYGGVKFNRGVGIFENEEVAKELASRYGYEIKPHVKDTLKSTELDTNKDTVISTKEDTKEKVEDEKPKRKPRKTKTKAGE